MESKRLDNAALAAGISPNYINAHGKPQSISAETKRRLLDAMHQRTATKVAVTPVPNVMVYTSGKKMPMVVEGSGEYSCGHRPPPAGADAHPAPGQGYGAIGGKLLPIFRQKC